MKQIAELYRNEERFFSMFTIFTLLAVFIASLGILGLSSFTAEQRTKEIGIRKVFGASIGNIVRLLLREFYDSGDYRLSHCPPQSPI